MTSTMYEFSNNEADLLGICYENNTEINTSIENIKMISKKNSLPSVINDLILSYIKEPIGFAKAEAKRKEEERKRKEEERKRNEEERLQEEEQRKLDAGWTYTKRYFINEFYCQYTNTWFQIRTFMKIWRDQNGDLVDEE
jgi:ribosomal protein L12E/L44/L45/RPP1/RPP2